jgi:hypothetical protein
MSWGSEIVSKTVGLLSLTPVGLGTKMATWTNTHRFRSFRGFSFPVMPPVLGHSLRD